MAIGGLSGVVFGVLAWGLTGRLSRPFLRLLTERRAPAPHNPGGPR
jgi:hypothetical protein